MVLRLKFVTLSFHYLNHFLIKSQSRKFFLILEIVLSIAQLEYLSRYTLPHMVFASVSRSTRDFLLLYKSVNVLYSFWVSTFWRGNDPRINSPSTFLLTDKFLFVFFSTYSRMGRENTQLRPTL